MTTQLNAAARLLAAKQPTWTSHKYPLNSQISYTDHKGRQKTDRVMNQVFYGPNEEPAYRLLDADGVVLESQITGRA